MQAEAVERVEYFHLELDTHDVILAEGAASETFVDDDSRGMFHNAADYRLLYPDAPRAPARFCAPRVEDGEALEAVRRRLAARAQAALPDAGVAAAGAAGRQLQRPPRSCRPRPDRRLGARRGLRPTVRCGCASSTTT